MGKSNKSANACNLKASILATTPIKQGYGIQMQKLTTSNTQNETILFSQKYFRCEGTIAKDFNDCFNSIYDYALWITRFLRRMSVYSTMTITELKQGRDSTRFNVVKGDNLKKLKNVLSEKSLDIDDIFPQDECESYYELSFEKTNGRVFGYLIGNKYYILLLDPNHLIYPYISQGAKSDLLHKRYDPWKELD